MYKILLYQSASFGPLTSHKRKCLKWSWYWYIFNVEEIIQYSVLSYIQNVLLYIQNYTFFIRYRYSLSRNLKSVSVTISNKHVVYAYFISICQHHAATEYQRVYVTQPQRERERVVAGCNQVMVVGKTALEIGKLLVVGILLSENLRTGQKDYLKLCIFTWMIKPW